MVIPNPIALSTQYLTKYNKRLSVRRYLLGPTLPQQRLFSFHFLFNFTMLYDQYSVRAGIIETTNPITFLTRSFA